MFPDIRAIEERVYWGVFSWSLSKSKQRWVRKNSIVLVNGLVCTPSDIVRDYLDYYYPSKLRAVGPEARTYEEHRAAPLYVRPTYLREACYVDIKATYYSIAQLVGWDIGYCPEEWLVPGRAPRDFPLPDDKSARNYLVSIGLPNPIVVWNGKKFIYAKGDNPHVNRGLWTFTMDLLHAIAGRAIELGARYVHTDGYILPADSAYQLVEDIAKLHLTADIRAAGAAWVFGFGNYKVGDKQTKGFDPYRQQSAWDNIRPVNFEWFYNRLNWVVEHDVPARLYRDSQF